MGRLAAYAALGIIIFVVGNNSANASGFLVRENGATAVGLSYAGNGSRADAADTVFSNPAGMTNLQSNEMEFGNALIIPTVTFQGTATAFGAPISGNDGVKSGRVVVIPNLYGSFNITDDLKAGLAITVPFGNASEYDSNWYGRYLGIKTAALSYDINPSLAYRLTDAISLGVGVSAQYLKLDVSNAIAQSIIFAAPVPDAVNRFIAHDWAFGFNLGLLAKVGDSTRVGVTYRSSVDHTIKGNLNFTGASPVLGLLSGPASSAVNLPATSGLSITSELNPNLTLFSDLQFTQWSVFKDVIVKSQNAPVDNKENYRDNWMLSLGGQYKLNPAWTVRGGLAWDETPVISKYRAVNLPDTDRYLLGIGSTYQWSDSITLDGAYGHSFAFSHPNLNASVNNTDSVTHAVVLKGEFDIAVNIVSFSMHYRY